MRTADTDDDHKLLVFPEQMLILSPRTLLTFINYLFRTLRSMKLFCFVLAAILNKSENTESEVMQVEKVFCHLQVNSNMTPSDISFFFFKGSNEFHTKCPLPRTASK